MAHHGMAEGPPPRLTEAIKVKKKREVKTSKWIIVPLLIHLLVSDSGICDDRP